MVEKTQNAGLRARLPSTTQNNQALADIFAEMAVLLEILGENAFRVRAYENVSRIFASLDQDAGELLKSGELGKIKGLGASTEEKVREFLEAGRIKAHRVLKARLPEGILDLIRIPGFGPKKAKVVYEALGIASLHELEEATNSGRLEELPGFGKKTEENIVAGIELVKKSKGRFLWDDAMRVVEPALVALSADSRTARLEVAGSLRRRGETVKDADILAATSDPDRTTELFLESIGPERVTARDDTKVSVVTESGMAVDLMIVPEEGFSCALHHFTGSRKHNIAMRSRAQKFGYKMNESGLFKVNRSGKEKVEKARLPVESVRLRLVSCASEETIFKKLGLAYIPPELREDMGEIEAAEKDDLPVLIKDEDLKGAIHVHSTYSDGHNSIEDLALAAKKLGSSYILISDHSRSAYYAGGLKVEDIKRQWREIDRLNKKLKGIRILRGIECDILADGTLDYDDGILASFDCVIASIHSGFTYGEEAQTKRLIQAAKNDYVDVIGHPTGRLLLQRDGYPVDMEMLLEVCAETGTAVEINGNPNRLDLDWRWVRMAKELGVRIILTSDAHRSETLTHAYAAVGVARKGWLERKDVLNTLPVKKFLSSLKQNR